MTMVGNTSILVAIVTKADAAPLTKCLSLGADGALVKDSAHCFLAQGLIESRNVTLRQFAEELLPALRSDQALVMTNRQFEPGTWLSTAALGGTTRTRSAMQYEPGRPALLLLDADPSAGYRAETPEQFLDDLGNVLPGVEACARVVTHSTSSWITSADGVALTAAGAFHTYIVISDPAPLLEEGAIKALRDRVLARAWLAGYGELFVDRAGRMHPRALLDVSVWQPERLSFEGPPVLLDGLVQNRPPPQYSDGAFFDLEAALVPLTTEEQQRYHELVAEARQRLQPEATARSGQYIERETAKLVERGLSRHAAAAQLRERLDGGVVTGDTLLYLNTPPDGAESTEVEAWRVLAEPELFDGAYCADPVEPDYGTTPGGLSTTKARLHADDGRPSIYSWAHGGRLFVLRHTPRTLRQHLTALAESDPERFREEYADIIGAAPLSEEERDQLVAELPAFEPMSGITKRTIRAALKYAGVCLPPMPYEPAPDLGPVALEEGGGELSIVEQLEPWPEPVKGEALEAIRDTFEHYAIADAASKDALALWALATFCYDAFSVFPKAFLTSPTKRCGKSITLEVLEAVVCRPLVSSSISAPSIFRAVELWRPTLLIDEVDRLSKDNEELIGIINSGHRKRTAFVIRTVKINDEHIPQRFSTWSPMALAGIGRMADTIMDRAIVIALRRKTRGERVAKLPTDLFERNHTLRRRCLRWANDHKDELRGMRVEMPQHGNDRAVDNWEPLVAIAHLVGGDWPERAIAAFHALTAEEEEEAVGVMLLEDILQYFEATGHDKVSSVNLATSLSQQEGRPWAEWSRGKPLTANKLARLLKPFKVNPHPIRDASGVWKGYRRSQFEDAFSRYLCPTPADPTFQTVTRLHPSNGEAYSDFQTVTRENDVTLRNRREPSNDEGCNGVTVVNGGLDGEEHIDPFGGVPFDEF